MRFGGKGASRAEVLLKAQWKKDREYINEEVLYQEKWLKEGAAEEKCDTFYLPN